MIEIETKIIDIDKDGLIAKLEKDGAEFIGKTLQKRWVFALEKAEGEDRFIRVRTDGKTATVTYKRRAGGGLANTEELETVVEDFDTAAKIFEEVLGSGLYQENIRYTYVYKNAEITINEWPKLRPVVEVEAKSEEEVRAAISEIGIVGKELGNISWEKVYAMHGMDLKSFKTLKFDE